MLLTSSSDTTVRRTGFVAGAHTLDSCRDTCGSTERAAAPWVAATATSTRAPRVPPSSVSAKGCWVLTYYWTRKNRWMLLGALLMRSVGLSVRDLRPWAAMTSVPGAYPCFCLGSGIALHTSVVVLKKHSSFVSPTYLKSMAPAPLPILLA